MNHAKYHPQQQMQQQFQIDQAYQFGQSDYVEAVEGCEQNLHYDECDQDDEEEEGDEDEEKYYTEQVEHVHMAHKGSLDVAHSASDDQIY